MKLTEREREILLLVAKDKSNTEIAQALSVSVTTVESHITNICTKLGVTSRLGAVMKGLVKGDLRFEEVTSYWLKYPGNPG